MNPVPVMNQPEISALPPTPPPASPQPAMSPEQLHADLNAIRSVLNESATARSPHRNVIAVGNLICGFFMLIAVPILLVVFSIPMLTSPKEDGVFIVLAIGLGIIALLVVLASPFLLAGWGLLKNKKWGIAAAMVAAVFNFMNFPFGTALSIYTIWAVSSGNLLPETHSGRR